MSASSINLLSFSGKSRALHLTWFAFFLTFFVWFNHAPLMAAIQEQFGLTTQQVKALLIINVALTIPARIVIGMLVDRFGPRLIYSALLFIGSLICFTFALADSYTMLMISRFALGFIGAGFVIGIRMIGEWFPARQVGLAEGIYGGWGNFGSAAAALSLPSIALAFGGDDGWRYAIGLTGMLALVYSVVYYRLARNTPKGSTYFKPKKTGAMEITSVGDFYLYLLMNIPLYATLALLTWKLGPSNLGILNATASTTIYIGLVVLYLYQSLQVWRINKHVFIQPVAEIHRYKFKQVAILDIAYLVTFGSELAVVSMLPLFFKNTFDLSLVQAGILASGFAFMNLVARPTGGLLSDRFGRRTSLAVLIACLAAGYFLLSQITSEWPLWLAVVATMAVSFFVQSGEGAVFATVPLIKRRMTGQIAGMAGAYGNVGAVLFLTVYSFVSASTFFVVISAAAVVAFLAVLLMDEPSGHTAEINEDGSVAMIEVS